MKRLLYPGSNTQAVDFALLVLRIAMGAMMLTHGLPKMEKLLAGGEIQFASVMGMSAATSLSLAVFAEVACAVLLVLGLFTRLAAIPLVITMFVAVFIIHSDDPFARKEMGLLYLSGYLTLLFTGPGRYSLDELIFGRKLR